MLDIVLGQIKPTCLIVRIICLHQYNRRLCQRPLCSLITTLCKMHIHCWEVNNVYIITFALVNLMSLLLVVLGQIL